MNKKILLLILLEVLILPVCANAATDYKTFTDNIVTTALYIASGVVVIGWIITGILYLTAQGSPEKLGTAKKALIAAIVGTVLIIVAGSAASLVKTALGI